MYTEYRDTGLHQDSAGSVCMILSGSLKTGIPFIKVVRLLEVIEMITSLIQNVGFPIACVIAMFHFWNKEREDHKSELAAVTDALNNNTLVLQSIRDHLMTNK